MSLFSAMVLSRTRPPSGAPAAGAEGAGAAAPEDAAGASSPPASSASAAAVSAGAAAAGPTAASGATARSARDVSVYFSHTPRVMKGGSITTASNAPRSSEGNPSGSLKSYRTNRGSLPNCSSSSCGTVGIGRAAP